MSAGHGHGQGTTARRAVAGPVLRRGTLGDYRAVVWGPGEAHRVRHDLVGRARVAADGPRRPGRGGRALAVFGHVTDLQLADVHSPVRFEFFNREHADPRFAELVPMHRAHEAFAPHAVQAMVDALNAAPGAPATGVPPGLVVTTGDAIDNAQFNELRLLLALLDGGTVRPGAGGADGRAGSYHGVQRGGAAGDVFWRPDTGGDLMSTAYGFPLLPGVLDRAMAGWRGGGLQVPWLACYGNHEALVTGVARVDDPLRALATGTRRTTALRPDADPDHVVARYTADAAWFAGGAATGGAPAGGAPAPWVDVPGDPDRRLIDRRQFVEAHFAVDARPWGHGFEARNRRDGTAYYAYDHDDVRFVVLDTADATGGADGCVDATQARWLASELQACPAHRPVVVVSHHGTGTLPARPGATGPDGGPTLDGTALVALLHRHPQVVLWLNGHTHRNRVVAHPAPHRPGGGFWEVTTCAVADWPGQARLVEVVDTGDGELSVVCTMLDHTGEIAPAPAALRAGDPGHLAGLHRELSANVPGAGFGSALEGGAGDRNVELRVRAPGVG